MTVGTRVREDDAIVLDFDPISALYAAYSDPVNAVMLPSMGRAEAERALGVQLQRCRANHAKVYFLGILDQTEASWKLFLNDRLGIPYASFDQHRLHSKIVERFTAGDRPLTLRVYEP